jgi:hypothetical protein
MTYVKISDYLCLTAITTYIIDSTLKLQNKLSLARVFNLVPKIQRNALTLLIICNVLRLVRLIRFKFRAVDLELVTIEHNIIPAFIVVDLEIDGYGSLIFEPSTKFEIVKGNEVVGWFGPLSLSC